MNAIQKVAARKLAQRLVILGKCEVCMEPATDRHHPDHSKPLDVICLCRKCHLQADAEILKKEGERGAAIRWANHSKEAICPQCKTTFIKERARQTNCSRSCGNLMAWEKKRGGIQNLKESQGLPLEPSIGHTDLKPSGMDKCRSVQPQHGRY